MIPRPSGGYREYESFPVIVVSHDCEWTKMLQSGTDDYKLGIAPLRRLSAFKDDAVVAEAPPGGLREDEDQATIIITKVIVVFEMAGPHYPA